MIGVAGPLVLTAALAAQAPATPAQPSPVAAPRTQVLVLDLEAINLPKDQAALVSGRIANVLDLTTSIDPLTMADLRQLADLEADKQASGCDQVSCLAEIASAMGARYVIFGRVARLEADGGSTFVGQLNLFDAQSARPVAREEWEARDLKSLLDLTEPTTARLIAPLSASRAPNDGPPLVLIGGGVLAGVGVAGGVVLGTLAALQYATLSQSAPPGASASEVQELRAAKAFAQDSAPVFLGLAVASAVVAVSGGALVALSFVLEE